MDYLQLNAIEFFNIFPSIAKWLLIIFVVSVVLVMLYFLTTNRNDFSAESFLDGDEATTDK